MSQPASLLRKRVVIRPRIAFAISCIALVIGLVVWFVVKWADVKMQYEVADLVESIGGKAYFDYQVHFVEAKKGASDYERRFDGTRELFVDPWFEQIQVIDLSSTDVTDNDIRWLANLLSLEELDLSRTRISGDGLKFLPRDASLDVLSLANSRVTDQSLQHVPSTVRFLDLSGTSITDVGIQYLKNLESPEGINLNNTNVTKLGVAKLRRGMNNGSIQWNDEWLPALIR